jgi:tRNA U34 2-thiouridine synthase MnmA/TrmU
LGISAEKPLYVIGLNKEKNEVILGFADESFKKGLVAHDLAWSSVETLSQPTTIRVKIRSFASPACIKIVLGRVHGHKTRTSLPDFSCSFSRSCCFYYLLIFLLYFRPQHARILHTNIVNITTLILLTLALWEAYYRGSF